MDRFAPFFPSRAAVLLLALSALLPLSTAPPARATGFMDEGPFKVQASDICANEFSFGCVEVPTTTSIEIWSKEESNSTTSWVSQAVSSPFMVKFNLTFSGDPELGVYAFYKIGSSPATQVETAYNVPYTIFLDPGDTLSFGVTQGNTSNSYNLEVSSFDATAVPAPLPLLGAGAAFGFIRRRRARLRAAAQAQ
ncbi:MAG: hypothetical protein R6W06_03010 [Prochlorococcaceae cyanobacterium]